MRTFLMHNAPPDVAYTRSHTAASACSSTTSN